MVTIEVLLNKEHISVVNWKRLIEVVEWKAVPIDILVQEILSIEESFEGKFNDGISCLKRLLRS